MKKPSIGLVLSGGGYKGLVHAGALQFLQEQNIKPNILAGTSAGAIVCCLYAIGMSPLEILDFFKSVNLFRWSHFTFSKPGLIDVYAFDKYLNQVFGNQKIKDLDIKTHITATNITLGKLHVFDSQVKITDAILASCAFPGIFSPYKIQDTLYSDGGVLNNFPTDVLKTKCEYVIGINACPIEQVESKDLTTIRAVTLRAYELMSAMYNKQQGTLCDWLIEPNTLSKYSTFERNKSKMDEIYQLGYQHTSDSFATKQDKLQKAIS
ncbi:patatin-like phospholipase family protein [Myroides sp. LJL119]